MVRTKTALLGNRFLVWIGRLLLLTSLALLAQELIEHADQLKHLHWSVRTAGTLFITISLSTVGVFLNGMVWHALLTSTTDFSSAQSCFIYARTQIGKYLPGNVFQYVGRAALANKFGFAVELCTYSILVECVVLAGSALCFSVLGLAWYGRLALLAELELTYVLSITAIVIAGGGLLSWFRPEVITKIFTALTRFLSWRALFTSVAMSWLSFCLFGVVLTLLSDSVFPLSTTITTWEFAAGFALAWVAGFVVPGAPGGLGIREYVLFIMFAPQLGEAIAVSLFVLMRFVSVAADLLAFVLAPAIYRPS